MRIKTLLLFVFLINFANPASAQQDTGVLKGTVLDISDGLFVARVNLVLGDSGVGTISDRNGVFRFAALSAGTYTVRVSMLGYDDLEILARVKAGETRHLVIELVPSAVELPELIVERESILGGRAGLADLPGSAHRISARTLEKFNHTDISRALRSVPGINIQEEDGYGLRPNIGIRGTGSERSSRISLMEDGVLTAPAPYAAPSAYYFPSVGRMSEIEIRKGSSQIKYGPYTTGGAINLLSSPIPDQTELRFKFSGGSNDSRLSHIKAGTSFRNGAFLLESFQNQSDGFKRLDYGGPTGFDKGDLMAKVRLNTDSDARFYQAIVVKVLRTTEVSNETYLGLTGADFSADPLRRYVGSSQDKMKADFDHIMVRHLFQFSARTRLTSTLYRSHFSRNWYKLDRVTPFGSKSVEIGSLLSSPDVNKASFNIISGGESSINDRLWVKANNRKYLSQGFQSEISTSLNIFSINHEIEAGIRIHRDEMDRFQWVDGFSIVDGEMILVDKGVPGTESNRIESAHATALFIQDRIELGKWILHPGLRYENIKLNRLDYGKADPEREAIALKKRDNHVRAWIPGMGVSLGLSKAVTLFGGVHKGFAPPGSRVGTKPEQSINIESGIRIHRRTLRADLTLFHNGYENLLGTDLASSGGTGSGEQFNGGAATVRGIEASFSQNLGGLIDWSYSIPVSFTYTLTDAVFDSSFESDFSPWGSVQSGFHLPYISKHIGSLSAGFEGTSFDIDVQASYVGAMRTVAGTGKIEPSRSTDRHIVIELGGSYQVNPGIKVFGSIRNLTDTVYIAARRPAGLRPGLPRTAVLGMSVTL